VLESVDLAYAHPGQATPYSFSFTALPGTVTAISGPSGSGKSTLLDLIAGFLRPISGSLRLDGKDLLSMPVEARPVSILFQSESLFEHLRADRNVALGLDRSHPRSERDGLIREALASVGLPEIGKQQANTLSGGQKQRVALARTLLRNRPVLLLDEPFSALDDDTRVAVRELVLRLTEERKWTTLLVSHHADDVEVIAGRRYRLEGGRLVEG
jgi:thiamine transport system ATP-binding protein